MTKDFEELPKAGAAVTCGVPNLRGLSKRPITEDFPKLAMSIAALVNFAATNADRMDAQIPLITVAGEHWQPSGLLETSQQMRRLVQVDSYPNRPQRQGPCVFGCQPKATLSENSSVQWYAVPEPSPWPGIQPGENLCKRCYTWSRTALGKRQRTQSQLVVGTIVKLNGLISRPELNGRSAKIVAPPNDDQRITVQVQGSEEMIRVALARTAMQAGSRYAGGIAATSRALLG